MHLANRIGMCCHDNSSYMYPPAVPSAMIFVTLLQFSRADICLVRMHSAFTLFLRPPSWSIVLLSSRCDVLCPQHSYSSSNFKSSPPAMFPRSPGDEPATAMLCLPQVYAASSLCQVEHRVATCPSLALPERGLLGPAGQMLIFAKI